MVLWQKKSLEKDKSRLHFMDTLIWNFCESNSNNVACRPLAIKNKKIKKHIPFLVRCNVDYGPQNMAPAARKLSKFTTNTNLESEETNIVAIHPPFSSFILPLFSLQIETSIKSQIECPPTLYTHNSCSIFTILYTPFD